MVSEKMKEKMEKFDRWKFYKDACKAMDEGDWVYAKTKFQVLTAFCCLMERESLEEREP